jgi:GNAT superfamily N-acetyltransferase
MNRRGRPTSVVSMMSHLQGSGIAKERAEVVFRNLGGGLSVSDPYRRLGVGRWLFRELRKAALEAALRVLEPRRPGRPRRPALVKDRRTAELEAKVKRLEEDLAVARVREEIAICLPRTGAGQKKRRSSRRAMSAGRPPKPPSRFGKGG